MMRKFAALSFTIAALILLNNLALTGSGVQASASLACSGGEGIVDKAPCAGFTVQIAFKNVGTTEGTWSVNIAFEGEKWTWTGAPQNLTLKPCNTKTLAWSGKVPSNATVGSVARLVVYYDDSFKALNWWIHVVPNAELAITSSTVK